ncbi:MAG: S41 family peptidase [Meiothermus sp.]|nr:S41 family peptidase [Meiothermus sp.]
MKLRLKGMLAALLILFGEVFAISPQAKTYLDRVLELLQRHYVRSETINWLELQQKAYRLAANAQLPADTYVAIGQVLSELGDGHMSFTPARPASDPPAIYGGGLDVRLGGGTVVRLAQGGPAEKAGLEVGDEIETVDGKPLVEPYQLLTLRYYEVLQLSVFRARTNQRRTVLLPLTELYRSPVPTSRLFNKRIGYLDVPQHRFADARQMDFASLAQQAIRMQDAHAPCGWVVDLRNNSGGLFYPMLLGVGPLLGEGLVGGLAFPKATEKWLYQEGRVMVRLDSRTTVMGQLSQPPYKLRAANSPVAVLIGPYTISAGEAVAIAFKGRPNTRFFGEPTFGYTTALSTFTLSDTAQISISVAFFADRNGNPYDLQVEPDEHVVTDWGFFLSERDAALQGAIQWLESQPACRISRRP